MSLQGNPIKLKRYRVWYVPVKVLDEEENLLIRIEACLAPINTQNYRERRTQD